MNDVRRADSNSRRRVIMLIVVAAMVGSWLIGNQGMLESRLADWLLSERQAVDWRLKLLLFAASIGMALPLLLFAGFMWRVGHLTIETREFPPSGFKVIRDMVVIRGNNAAKSGHIIKWMAITLGILAFVVEFMFLYVMKSLIWGA